MTAKAAVSSHAKVLSSSIQCYMKICRQHDSHGIHSQSQQLPPSRFVVYTALYTEKDLFRNGTPEAANQLDFCKQFSVEDKLFLIQTSLVDLLQLSSKDSVLEVLEVLEAPESTEK